jgi:hypothetical protein
VRVRLNGAHTVSKTFQRKTDARKWVQKTEFAIRQPVVIGIVPMAYPVIPTRHQDEISP